MSNAYDAIVVGGGHNGLVSVVPQAIGSHLPTELAALARLSPRNRGVDARTVAELTRLMTMSIADLVDDCSSPRTRVAGLYNASSAMHAGGGASGIPGRQAAPAVLRDARAERRSPERLLARMGR